MFLFDNDIKSIKSITSLKWHELFFLLFIFCQSLSMLFNFLLLSTEYNFWYDLKKLSGIDSALFLTVFALISLKFSKPYLAMACISMIFYSTVIFLVAYLITNYNLTIGSNGKLTSYYGLITSTGWVRLTAHPIPVVGISSLIIFLKQLVARDKKPQIINF